MATATAGIFWCLVLVDFILLSSAATLTQTSPSYTPVCPGDRLVLTCVATTGMTFWRIPGHESVAEQVPKSGAVIEGLTLNITNVNGSTVTTTGIYESINESMNGSVVGCTGNSFHPQFDTLTINIRDLDPPVAVNNISINPINSNTIIINWLHQQSIQCIDYCKVIVNDSNGPPSQHNYSTIGNSPNITIGSLIIGTNYSFIIIPIDTIGREGPPSSLIQYIWNVPAQVVNISWYQISTDSITVWWNNTEDRSIHYPPVHYIIIVDPPHNNINGTTNANITITGLPLTDTNYTVSIIPVNVIGYGPSATVNVYTISITSTIIMDTITLINSQFPTSTGASLTMTTEATSCKATQLCTRSIISVAIAVPITGLLTGLITSIITSIIVYCIMKNKGNKQQLEGAAVYDLPIINKQQQQDINTHTNTAYGHVNY